VDSNGNSLLVIDDGTLAHVALTILYV